MRGQNDCCRPEEIERVSGLTRAALEAAAREYARASAVIVHYGMGLAQHRMGVQNVRMVCNLRFLRGNVGKPGAGPSPVRGHSNVQGQRTVGIAGARTARSGREAVGIRPIAQGGLGHGRCLRGNAGGQGPGRSEPWWKSGAVRARPCMHRACVARAKADGQHRDEA